MKSKFKKNNLAFILVLFTHLGWAQPPHIQVEFIGNCGLHMTDGTTNFYIDFPYKSGAYGYIVFDQSELDSIKANSIFIFTHKHADHYSDRLINRVIKARGGTKYDSWHIKKFKQLNQSIPNFHIQVFKTKHHFSFKHCSYLITWHNKKIFISGDTEHAETIGQLKNIDWAFVPYWLLLDAKEKSIEIDADMFAIYHLATEQIPSAKEHFDPIEHMKPMIKQGEKFTIELDD